MLPIFLFAGCGKSNGSDKKGSTVVTANQVQKSYIPLGEVNSDSAYQFVADQVAFGPRVPGSEAHRLCGYYLVEKLTQYGATVEEQIGEARLYNGRPMAIRNIIGRYNPEAKRRIFLVRIGTHVLLPIVKAIAAIGIHLLMVPMTALVALGYL